MLRLFTRNASTEAQNCSDTTQAQRLRTAQNHFCEHSISHLLLSFFMSIMPQLILFDISNICFMHEQDSSSSWDLKLSCSDCVLCFMHSIPIIPSEILSVLPSYLMVLPLFNSIKPHVTSLTLYCLKLILVFFWWWVSWWISLWWSLSM